MTDSRQDRLGTHDPYRYGGVTTVMARRFVVSFAFWTFGIVGVLAGAIQLVMLVVVPALSLQNETWNRADNPITLRNGLVGLVVGAIAIYGALGSNRRRGIIVFLSIVAAVLDGARDLGLFSG